MLYIVKTINNNSETISKNPLKMVFFVIKKKVFKKAVDRNRVKRRARSSYLEAISSLKKDYDEKKIDNFFKTKKILFFLEHDMINEVYSHIVLDMKNDLIRLIKLN